MQIPPQAPSTLYNVCPSLLDFDQPFSNLISNSKFFKKSHLKAPLFFVPIIPTAHYSQRNKTPQLCTCLFIFQTLSFAFLSSLRKLFLRCSFPVVQFPRCTRVTNTQSLRLVVFLRRHPLPAFLSPPMTLSQRNSLLMGFIGFAIHLSAAAHFNYIRRPSGLSQDTLQLSPPYRTHTHTHIRTKIYPLYL